MEKLLKQMLETMKREQSWFVDVEAITKYSDWSVHITHLASNPTRKIEVELESIEKAISYVNSF